MARHDQKAEGHAAQPVTYFARQSNRDWVSFYFVCRWRVPSRMWFSSSPRSLQFPLWLLHSHSREAVAWGIWKTPAGNERNFCFSFFLNHPLTPCSLYFGCLCTAGLLSFLVSECSPTITTSHKQWGLLIGGLRRRVAVAGPCRRFLLAVGLANGPKSPKVQATSGTVKDLRATLKMHHLWRTINTCFSSFLIYLSSKRTLMDQTLKGDAGQCQETTKVQGKNCSFGIPCFYSTHGLIKGVWITSSGILNKTTMELCPILSAYRQNAARVTCHLNSRATIKPLCLRQGNDNTEWCVLE